MDTFWGQGSLRDFNGTQVADYTGKTLVENNISYENGGAGIYACAAVNTDFVNNISYNASIQRKFSGCRIIFLHQRRFNEAGDMLTACNPKRNPPLYRSGGHFFYASLY